jgi:hypothetical protein
MPINQYENYKSCNGRNRRTHHQVIFSTNHDIIEGKHVHFFFSSTSHWDSLIHKEKRMLNQSNLIKGGIEVGEETIMLDDFYAHD